MQTSLSYVALTVIAERWLYKKKVEAGYHCRRFMALLDWWLCCLCIGELRFKLVSGGFPRPHCLSTLRKPSLS